MVLGGAPQHGRSADVDVFNGIVEGHVGFGHGGLKGIKIHHHQVDGGNLVGGHGRLMGGITADKKQAAMHFGVKGLHPAIEHFRKTGMLADIFHFQPRFAQGFGGAAGGNEFQPLGSQDLGKGNQPGLVGNRKQSALDFHAE